LGTDIGLIAAVFSISWAVLAGIALLVKLWHEPRFVSGILPAQMGEPLAGSLYRGNDTAQRVRYRQRALSQPREHRRDSDGIARIPIIIQNQGHGIASALTVTIELDTDILRVLDVCTEALLVTAVFGDTSALVDRLHSVAADRRILQAYAQIGKGGTYVEMVGAAPASAVELVVMELQSDRPVDFLVTIRAQTPQRMLQQTALRQSLRIT